MHTIVLFIRKYTILVFFFVFLFFCLFLGEIPQSAIDMIGISGSCILYFLTHFFIEKKREVPLMPFLFFVLLLFYYIIRTIFSNDIGYSVYALIRMISVFSLGYVLYCYLDDADIIAFPFFLVGFCSLSCIVSIIYIIFPLLNATLPNTNLLIPSYGHNHIVDVLLFGFPVTYFFYIYTKKRIFLFFLCICLLGIVGSLSRAAIIATAIFSCVSLLFIGKHFFYHRYMYLFSFVCLCCLCILGLITPFSFYERFIPSFALPKIEKQKIGEDGRIEYFRQAVVGIQKNLLFGYGPGTFSLVSREFQKKPDTYSRFAHNSLLEQLSDIGMIGFLFCVPIYIWFIREWIKTFHKNLEIKKKRVFISLSGVLIMAYAYSFVSFSLSFFVVQTMFLGVIVVISLISHQSEKREHIWISNCVGGMLGVTFLFYVIVLFSFFPIFSDMYFFRQFRFLNEIESYVAITEDSSKLTYRDRLVILQLHKRNPVILYNFDSYTFDDAMRLYPQDFSLQRDVFITLLQKKQYEKTGIILYKILRQTIPETYIPLSYFTDVRTLKAYEKIDMVVLNKGTYKEQLAKYCYLLGYSLLSSDISFTEKFWTAAVRLAPQWSYFAVELASLYQTAHEQQKAQEVLIECEKNDAAREHCQDIRFSIIPYVGFFKINIEAIPLNNTHD